MIKSNYISLGSQQPEGTFCFKIIYYNFSPCSCIDQHQASEYMFFIRRYNSDPTVLKFILQIVYALVHLIDMPL